jgi:mannose-6-phosphate isomerase
MAQLYPLVFQTQYKDKIWGGNKIKTVLGKDFGNLPNCGETWEISGVQGNISVVKNGALQGKNLVQLIQEYKDQLVGKKVYEKSGDEFPLLIKFIDANDDLSIQVHPDDALALKRHNSLGKTEMWYVFEADKGAKLNAGFNKEINQETYLKHLQNKTLDEILNFEDVAVGDVYFLPAGRVHYIGKGVCLAEIQQTSDITYRIYDFDRKDDKGNLRELHTDLALDAIDYKYYGDYKTKYTHNENAPVELVKCQYFKTQLLEIDTVFTANYNHIDSFVIYICFEGSAIVSSDHGNIELHKGDSILLPAVINNVTLTPQDSCKFLETYVP